jgi:hypothetical protein
VLGSRYSRRATLDEDGAVPEGCLDVMFCLLGAGTGVSVVLQQVLNANLLNGVGLPMVGRIHQLSLRHSGNAGSRHHFC